MVPWEIYSHGYALRLRVAVAAEAEFLEALRRVLDFDDDWKWFNSGERRCYSKLFSNCQHAAWYVASGQWKSHLVRTGTMVAAGALALWLGTRRKSG